MATSPRPNQTGAPIARRPIPSAGNAEAKRVSPEPVLSTAAGCKATGIVAPKTRSTDSVNSASSTTFKSSFISCSSNNAAVSAPIKFIARTRMLSP